MVLTVNECHKTYPQTDEQNFLAPCTIRQNSMNIPDQVISFLLISLKLIDKLKISRYPG